MFIGNVARPIEILLVEDNPGDIRLTLEAFKDAKVANHVSVVTDGIQALNHIHRQNALVGVLKPDLVLLDLNLPGKDGRTVLGELRADRRFARLPVVVLTTSHSEEDMLRSQQLDVTAYMVKPVDFAQLITVVKQIDEFHLTIVSRLAEASA